MAITNDTAAVSWRMVAVAACTLIITGGSYLIGDTLSNIRVELRDVRQTLDQRASLSPRLDSVERQTYDQEQRLREVEIRMGVKR